MRPLPTSGAEAEIILHSAGSVWSLVVERFPPRLQDPPPSSQPSISRAVWRTRAGLKASAASSSNSAFLFPLLSERRTA